MRAIRDSLTAGGRYPADLSYEGLKDQFGKFHGLAAENILIGTGSTEILKVCDDYFLQSKPHLVVADTTYDAVYQYAVNSRAEVSRVPLTKDHRHDLARMANAITSRTGLVFICNPTEVAANGGDCDGSVSTGTQVGSSVSIDSNYQATSTPDFTGDTVDGKWCWRAEFTPDTANSPIYDRLFAEFPRLHKAQRGMSVRLRG